MRAGKILVNGQKATLGDKVSGEEKITVNGTEVETKVQEKIVLAFHKPIGIESTLQTEPKGETLTAFDFGARVFPIGRLDKNSRGLLLLTNDGELCNHLAHPRYEHEKEYLVTVDKPITSAIVQRLSKGCIKLDGKLVLPCAVEKLKEKECRIVLREGRNKQIRRMCDACGLTVTDLLRVRVGDVFLEDIKSGIFRKLTEEEMERIGSNVKC